MSGVVLGVFSGGTITIEKQSWKSAYLKNETMQVPLL